MHDNCGITLGPAYQQLACAGFVAVDDFNSRHSHVVPQLGVEDYGAFGVRPVVYDTRRDNRATLQVATTAMQEGAHVVVGPARSYAAVITAQVAALYQVPQVSYSASAPLLTDESRYPLFARTCADDDITTLALSRVIREFGWRNIGVVYDRHGVYTNAYAEGLRQNAGAAGVRIAISAPFETSQSSSAADAYVRALERVQRARVNVIVAVLDGDASGFFSAVDSFGLRDAGAPARVQTCVLAMAA
jgi:ABC-type branched-subunit amino acid transport system substrate-binding protein